MRRGRRRKAMIVLWGCVAALALVRGGGAVPAAAHAAAAGGRDPGARGNIPATVQMPGKLARGGEVPLVVLCHGFTGSRLGDGHFEPLAAQLAEQGVATVRLDFAGCGASAEPYTAYTLTNMAADVDSVIAWMRKNTASPAPWGW